MFRLFDPFDPVEIKFVRGVQEKSFEGQFLSRDVFSWVEILRQEKRAAI